MKKDAPRSAGNGRDCISVPAHGASIVLTGGREWCPHQSHDGRPASARGGEVKPTTPWLDRQTDGTQAVEAQAS
jgi:hypothetical protein